MSILAFITRFFKAMTGKIYIDKDSNLSPEQYRRIAVGALYSEQQTCFINNLRLGTDKDFAPKILSNAWDVNSPAEALENLEYLSNKGFLYYFDAVYKAFRSHTEDEQKQILIDAFKPEDYETEDEYQNDLQKAYSQLINLKETWKELCEAKIVSQPEDLLRYSNEAWDIGRLNFVARLSFDAEYISQEQAWHYIDLAYERACKRFSNWQDFAYSYIIGRAMWGGTGCYNGGIISIARYLLSDPKSPWMQMPLK